MDVYNLFRILEKDDFSLFYLGEFDDNLTYNLISAQDKNNDQKDRKKRLAFLIAECFQNIIRHSEGLEKLMPRKMFMIRSHDSVQEIASVNPVNNKNIKELEDSLLSLQNLTQDELTAVYFQALGTNQLSGKGGGGLGLIEMARKSNFPPRFDFFGINEEFSNFFFQIAVDFDNQNSNEQDIDQTIELYKILNDAETVMVKKGDFSQETLFPVFTLFEQNLHARTDDLNLKKKGLYIMIEILQNVNRHGFEREGKKEGIFVVTQEEDTFRFTTGNYIARENVNELKLFLEELNQMDKIQLSKLYMNRLMDKSRDEGGAGIGLIDVFRQSHGNIQFQILDVNELYSFFTFSAIL